MSKKKYILTSVLSFIMIAVLFISIPYVSYFLRPRETNRINTIGLYAEKKNSLDMIYIGGSACFVFWEPLRAWESKGFTSYNFAHDSMNPQDVKCFIIEAQKTQNPELWVIDLRPFQYGENDYGDEIIAPHMYSEIPIRNATDNLSYSLNRKHLIDASVPDYNKRFDYYFDLAKYHGEWAFTLYQNFKEFLTGDFSGLDYIDNVVENCRKGFYFIPKTNEVSFTDYSNVMAQTKIDDKVNDFFLDLLNYCKSDNLNVLFIVHSYCQTEEQKKEFNYMQNIIDEYGFDFLNTNDYYQEIGLDYSFDFYNDAHVNIFGAEKYTDFVSNYITENYDLPDKRNNSDYASWNDESISFDKEVEKTKEEILEFKKNKD